MMLRRTLLSLFAAILIVSCTPQPAATPARALAGVATSRPSVPIVMFFQPVRNVPRLAALGINTFAGPEVENSRTMPPATLAQRKREWVELVRSEGAWCILKGWEGPLPDNCLGLLLSQDEPNRANTGPNEALKLEAARLRSTYPGVPIYLVLAGDKILSGNFAKPNERQVYIEYAALYDVAFTDFYERNRNADRYPDTFSGDIVKKLQDATGKPCIPFLEVNDQQLPRPPAPATNRAPTTQEIRAKAVHAKNVGAKGLGWFSTCDSGKFGWPQSYLPDVDRYGVSMEPQYQTMGAISLEWAPRYSENDLLRAQNAVLRATLENRDETIRRAREVLGQ